MKKLFLLSIVIILFNKSSLAQSVGIGTTTPDASSMLEVKSSDKGLLLPRTSATSRTAIVNPAKGLIVYDTTTGSFWFHNGSAWTQIESGGGNWSLTGNGGSNPATNFVGTTDANSLAIKVNNQRSGYIDYTSPFKTNFGYQSLNAAFGTANSAFGYQALFTDTSGIYNTAHGYQSLYSNSMGSFNTAIGAASLNHNSTGNYNMADGYYALYSNIDGYSNTASGYYALYANNYGHGNSGFGTNALNSNTTANFNSAFGYASLYSNSTGTYNTACGSAALYNNNGSYNTAGGFEALRLNNDSYNTAFGYQALRNTTASEYNVAFGYNAGTTLNNGYNNVFLGANTDVNGIGYYNVIAIGQATVCTAASQVTIGNSATNSYRAYANWSNISDGRYKNNLREDVPGLKFINELRPVTYTLNATAIDQFLHKNTPADKKLSAEAKAAQVKALSEKEQVRYTGFVAQEVEKTAKKLGFDFSGIDAPKNENDLYALRYADFVVPLVKAVQEQQQQIEELKKQNTELINRIDALEKK
ncbi:hypothetical protein FW778_19910 [Ginsengibacter hankyongi]|uniref:Peptidase S74 domain-containing protein n=1 Tax=Ginsengibacter hankyongi TaxID=2607284 RepID=A0A5J5ICA1_9BACT|nr:tail fiber domain-containing protein [Ginsengibacter hankyongi]KAA9035824.1 hypothetical protein FW778_19910 [Ginsengibacter hankyongi]